MKEPRTPLFSVTAKDCEWDYYVGSGSGGQKKNKTANCVRCTHRDSGAVGKSEEGRSQRYNKEQAFRKMAGSDVFKRWLRVEYARKAGIADEVERAVEKAMRPHNIKTEYKVDGKWTEAFQE